MTAQVHDSERYPTLTVQGRQMLDFMREHPCAPIYRNASGNRLQAGEVRDLIGLERVVLDARIGWHPGEMPCWIRQWLVDVYETVPYYRQLGSAPLRFESVSPVSRADLAADIAQFVPTNVELARMIHFRTTGTTGHPLLIPSHPKVAGRYLGYHKRALRRFGVEPAHRSGQVGVVLLGYQRKCFTYVSVTPTMDESGLAKINLHPDEWREPGDRARYLDALAPEIIAGDPISLAEYMTLPVTARPRAIMSVSMSLLPGMRKLLMERFGCPVLDIYSLNEVGPVGVFDDSAGGHLLLQERLFVEILDAAGCPVAAGDRGEITLTGGFNFFLPLLRYRTGDYGSLSYCPDGPVIVGLSGRQPVRFLAKNGWINNIDVTHALQRIAISHYSLHQQIDGGLVLRLDLNALPLSGVASAALRPLFGGQAIRVEALGHEDKTIQYTSELKGAHE